MNEISQTLSICFQTSQIKCVERIRHERMKKSGFISRSGMYR